MNFTVSEEPSELSIIERYLYYRGRVCMNLVSLGPGELSVI